MSTIVHFDIGADNTERAKIFYTELFGWKFNLLPGPMNYYLIETNDLSGVRGIGGGMGARNGQKQGMTNYFGVTSMDESIKKVKELGGKVIQEKQDVPGWGSLAVCSDTENNTFGLFEETH